MFAGPTRSAAPASHTWSNGHSFCHCGEAVSPPSCTEVLFGPNGPDPNRYRSVASDVLIDSQPPDLVTRYPGTRNRRFNTLTVGASSKLPFGEYSIRIRPVPRTWKRASPASTVAD